MSKVTLMLLEKVDGKTVRKEFELEEGITSGIRLRRAAKCGPDTLYSVDVWGHVQEAQGVIKDDEVIYIRPGREFMKIEKGEVK